MFFSLSNQKHLMPIFLR